jgi:hypothetical protein
MRPPHMCTEVLTAKRIAELSGRIFSVDAVNDYVRYLRRCGPPPPTPTHTELRKGAGIR